MDPVDLICWHCKHNHLVKKCPAFPLGKDTPDDIISGKNKHTQKHPDQVGDTVFEPLPDGQTVFDPILKRSRH